MTNNPIDYNIPVVPFTGAGKYELRNGDIVDVDGAGHFECGSGEKTIHKSGYYIVEYVEPSPYHLDLIRKIEPPKLFECERWVNVISDEIQDGEVCKIKQAAEMACRPNYRTIKVKITEMPNE